MIDLMMVLNSFTKRDLKDIISRMEDEEGLGQIFITSTKGLLHELKKLLEYNEGRRDGDLISWINTKGQTALDQFFEVYK